jgi:hypothetical protein
MGKQISRMDANNRVDIKYDNKCVNKEDTI